MTLSTLAVEAIASGVIVLALSLLTEFVSPRVSGLLSGTPLGVVLVYFFVGRAQGVPVVVESVPHAVAGLSATLASACAYLWGAGVTRRLQPLPAVAACVGGFLAVALPLSVLSMSTLLALAMTLAATLAARRFLIRRSRVLKVENRVRMTIRLMLLRAGASAALVVTVIQLARVLGPEWKGLLIGFPMNLLPLLVIIHITYGREIVGAMLRHFPVGLVALVSYILSVPLTFPAFGATGGTLGSLAVAWLALAALPLLHRLAVPLLRGQ